MDPLQLCDRYFGGWTAHDADAVLATLAPGGTYRDPLTRGPLAGDALRGYMQGTWAVFPDLGLEIGAVHRVAERAAECAHLTRRTTRSTTA